MEKGVIDNQSRLVLEQLFKLKPGQNANPIQFIDLFEVIEPDALHPKKEEEEIAIRQNSLEQEKP